MDYTKGVNSITSIQSIEEHVFSVKAATNRYMQSGYIKKVLERTSVERALPQNIGLKVDVRV